MPAQTLTLVPPALRGRVEAARAHEPLCGLAAAARSELDAVLARAEAFEDLPGKWQAALLAAEAGRAGAAPPQAGGCCHGG